MNLETVKEKLKANNIPGKLYSLDGGLKHFAYIIYSNYGKWEFFYLNERGGRDDFHVFYTEEEALDSLWSRMEVYLKNPPQIPPKSVFGNRK